MADKQFEGVGLEYNERFTNWWAVARQSEKPPSPQEFLENFGVDPKATDQFLCGVLKDALPIGTTPTNPGVIDCCLQYCFSATSEALQGMLNEVLENMGRAIRRGGGRGPELPTEQDLLALADVTAPSGWKDILYLCLEGSYSAEFLQSMFQKVPGNVRLELQYGDITSYYRHLGRPGFRQELDHDCVLGIKKILPKLHAVSMAGRWNKAAFAESLGLHCQASGLRRLEVHLPICGDEEGDAHLPLLPETQDESGVCGVKKFIIDTRPVDHHVDSRGSPWLGAGHLALDCLEHMPHLQTLDMKCYSLPLQLAAPHIVQLLENDRSQLESLILDALATTEMPAKAAALEIMEALNKNSSLRHFTYTESAQQVAYELAAYEEKVLQALQDSNTTLTHVELKPSNVRIRGMRAFRRGSECWSKRRFFLALNQCGRSMAREASTKVSEFVRLLSPKRIRSDSEGERSDHPAINWTNLDINYGLLREMPITWSTHVCSTTSSSVYAAGGRNRKGKRGKRKREHGGV